jgi:hypothetical protein
MSSEKVSYLYFGSTIIVVLILLLFVQLYKRKDVQPIEVLKKYQIVIDTPKGLIRSSNIRAAHELSIVRDQLIKKVQSTPNSCLTLVPLIQKSITNLFKFINENPRINSEALCKFELRSDLVTQAMNDSVTPRALDWESTYKTIVEWEEKENDMKINPRGRLVYLIKNIDIVVAMLRNDICDYGRINLTKLYEILTELNTQLCKNGSEFTVHPSDELYNEIDFKSKREKLHAMKNMEIKYNPDQMSIKPFDGHTTLNREPISKEAFGSINDIPFADLGYGSTINVAANDSNAFNKVYKNTRGYMNMDIPDNINDYSELVGQASLLNNVYNKTRNQPGSTLLDRSIEGTVERDILGYKSPGHIISQLYDSSDHYTTRVNSCLGKTVSDDELWANCTKYDMRAKKALDGEAGYLITKLDQSYHI